MRILGIFDWVRFWLSVLLVAMAAILLAVAQRVDEEPVAYWLRGLLAEMAVGLEKADPGSGRDDE